LDTEVVSMAALERAWREAIIPYQRIHVTPYFYQNPEIFAIFPVIQREDLSSGRWTVDTPEDLEFVRAIYDRLGPDDAFSWRDVCRVLCEESHLAELNRHVLQKRLAEG
jgi:spore coat polysaccharide biosynthesis protein SpsF